MRMIIKKISSYLFAGMLLITMAGFPTLASAKDYKDDYIGTPSGGEMMLDGILIRPLMLVSTVLGTAVFVITLPFTAFGGNVGDAADRLIVEPGAYTFGRPLGEIQ